MSNRSNGPNLKEFVGQTVVVKLGKREIKGKFSGFDQFLNVVIDSLQEYKNGEVYGPKMGRSVIRGSAITSILPDDFVPSVTNYAPKTRMNANLLLASLKSNGLNVKTVEIDLDGKMCSFRMYISESKMSLEDMKLFCITNAIVVLNRLLVEGTIDIFPRIPSLDVANIFALIVRKISDVLHPNINMNVSHIVACSVDDFISYYLTINNVEDKDIPSFISTLIDTVSILREVLSKHRNSHITNSTDIESLVLKAAEINDYMYSLVVAARMCGEITNATHKHFGFHSWARMTSALFSSMQFDFSNVTMKDKLLSKMQFIMTKPTREQLWEEYISDSIVLGKDNISMETLIKISDRANVRLGVVTGKLRQDIDISELGLHFETAYAGDSYFLQTTYHFFTAVKCLFGERIQKTRKMTITPI